MVAFESDRRRLTRNGLVWASIACAVCLAGLVWIGESSPEVVAGIRAMEPEAGETLEQPALRSEPPAESSTDRKLSREVLSPIRGESERAPSVEVERALPLSEVDELPSFWPSERRRVWKAERAIVATLSTDELIEDLKDDKERYNAIMATAELGERIESIDGRWKTRRLLEFALDSTDRQQRWLALGLLQSFSLLPQIGGAAYHPPERMLDVCEESFSKWSPGYRQDMIPYDLSSEKTIAFAVQFLDRLEGRVEELLAKTKRKETKLLCAYLLARGKRIRHFPIIAPILIEHLEDNRIPNDALLAMEGLFSLGTGSIAWLESSRAGDDPQAAACARLLKLELGGPAKTEAEREQRGQLTNLTHKCENPLREWSYVTSEDYLVGFTNGL